MAPSEPPAPDPTRQTRRFRVLLAVIVAFAAVIVAVVMWFRPESPVKTKAKAPETPRVQSDTGLASPTERQRELREQAQRQEAERARRQGESFIPVPVADESRDKEQSADNAGDGSAQDELDALRRRIERGAGRPRRPRQRVRRRRPPPSRGRLDADRVEAKREALESLAETWSAPMPKGTVHDPVGDQGRPSTTTTPAGAGQRPARASTAAANARARQRGGVAAHRSRPERPTAEAVTDLRPGQLLYARIDTRASSDHPGPVRATVLDGALREARLIGQFRRRSDKLVMVFDRLVVPEGPVVGLEAVAVDPDTRQPAVATDVDHHRLSRWGTFIAANFLAGLGSAIRQDQATVTESVGAGGGAQITRTGDFDVGDQLGIAAGEVGRQAGRRLERHFDRPPTVTVAAGTEVGVLVVDTRARRQDRRPASTPAAGTQPRGRRTRERGTGFGRGSGDSAEPLHPITSVRQR